MAKPLSTYITSTLSGTITSDFITSAGNLMCCLTPTQINSITSTVFGQSVSALAKISLTCPNIASWYTYAKASATYSSLLNSTSALTELGSIICLDFLLILKYKNLLIFFFKNSWNYYC